MDDEAVRQSGQKPDPLVVVGIVLALAVGLGLLWRHLGNSGKSDTPPAVAASTSNIYVVASKSFCVPTGIDDLYTGDGHVTFFVTLRNSGTADGDVSVTPVRHYDDGELNESPMDSMEAKVSSGQTYKFRSPALTYKAHSHEVTGCGLIIDGRDEVSIPLMG